VLMGAALCFGVLLFFVGWSHSAPLTMGLMFLIGASGVMFMTTANTRLQLLTPGHLRGRVMGMYTLLFLGTTPIGSMLVGELAHHNGVQATVLEMAGLCLLGVAAGGAYAWRKRGHFSLGNVGARMQ
ncbi:MAG: MFS transporter, partial [Thermoleophilia bacterium]|nr:MFS transporter [Thermoleophilia bacterium]